MDLSALNRTPIGAAARAVGAVTSFAFESSSSLIGSMRWRARSTWSLLINRTRFDYRTEVGDPALNSIVGAVVGWIARNFPDAPVRIVREGTTEIAYLPAPTGPGYMLRLLERPNRYFDGVVQWMATIVDFVRGDAYWYKERAASSVPGVPGRVVALWWLPRWMMEPAWDQRDPTSFITHYVYTVDGVAYKIPEADVVHFRNGINPRNPRKGVDRLDPLLREIFTDDEAANFTASVLRNLGVPGVIIAPANTTAGGPVGKADTQTIKDRFRETFGGDRRGEPMVLTGPSEIKVLSWNPQEMDLKALRRIPEERVAANLGVPAGVAQLGAGLDRNTFTNYGEAKGSAYTEGVIPLQRLIAATLEVQLLAEFVDLDREPLDVWFDWTKVSAMQAAVMALWKAMESAATKGLITRADFLSAVHMPVDPRRDDVYILPNNFLVVPAGGGPPPSPGGTARVEPPQLEGSALPLLTSSAPELRCGSCGRLLAESAPPGTRIRCRCKAVTEAPAAA